MFGVRKNLSECLGKALIYKLLFNHILAQTRHVYTTLFFLRTFLREFARKKKNSSTFNSTTTDFKS